MSHEPPPSAGTQVPFHVMAKPAGPLCNLECAYCFYLEKKGLFPRDRRMRMGDDVLEEFIRQYIEAQPIREVSFAWQGGEPTLLGLDFFRKATALQKKHARGKRIENALQTNGILLDDEWCRFLRREGFLVGLSLDGPRDLHDAYRVDRGGAPTFERVIEAADRLRRHQVDFNLLTVIHAQNARQPLEVYRFLKGIGSRFLQFIPIVEREPNRAARERNLDLATPPPPVVPHDDNSETPVTEWSVRPEDYGEFLIRVFDEWVSRDVGRIFVRHFDVALAQWAGMESPLCIFARTCGRALAVEHDGSLYACDHYVYPEYRLGNLLEEPLSSLVDSSGQRRFGRDKSDALPASCRSCEHRWICNGGCPKHRFGLTPDGEYGLNHLCPAYKRYFAHIAPKMEEMAKLVRAGRPAADILRNAV